MKTRNQTKVIILGGGYVGVHAYRSLMKEAGNLIRSGNLSITVVDPQTHHTFHGWSGETVAGTIRDESRLSPLRELFRHARVVRGYAIHVDREIESVLVKPVGSEEYVHLPYDHLVIGTGVRDLLESVPGVGEYGVTLRGTNGPEGLRRRIIELVERADVETNPEIRREMLTFVIAGGGFTGVETTASLAELLGTLRPYYQTLQQDEPQIILVHSGGKLLPQLGEQFPKLVDYATRSLLDHGVRFRPWTRVVRVTPDGAELNDGTFIRSRTVISAIGVSMRTLPGTEDFRRDRSGRIYTIADLRAEGSENVWVGGDAAHVTQPGRETACQASAHWSIKHGEHIGKNIVRRLHGLRTHPFNCRTLLQAAGLGVGKGIAVLQGMQFTGTTGWVIRLLYFLSCMPSRRAALRVLTEWLALPFTGRTITISDQRSAAIGLETPQRTTHPHFHIRSILWDRN